MICTTHSSWYHKNSKPEGDRSTSKNHLADKMRPTFIYTALLLSFVVSTNAEIKDDSILELYPEKCESTLQIRIHGEGQSESEAAARIGCVSSCLVGTREFKNNRCLELCGCPTLVAKGLATDDVPTKHCKLCSNGADGEIQRCKDAVDYGILFCKKGCANNPLQGNKPNYKVSSTSGGIYRKFPSEIITLP